MLIPKYSERIQSIISLVPRDTETIWDLCCDHGQIGKYFLPNKHVIFVDRVKSIMEGLEDSLIVADIPRSRYILFTKDILSLNLNTLNTKNCIILVGVGADLIIKFLKIFEKQLFNCTLTLCAHQNSFKLREYLYTQNYVSVKEVLIKENKQFYEHLVVKVQGPGQKISLIGDSIWGHDIPSELEYVETQLNLFKIKAKHDSKYIKWKSGYKDLYFKLKDSTILSFSK